MTWNLVSLQAQPEQPWRNGGGMTRELLAFPAPAQWTVRISVADIQTSGPFSRFDGIERWFAVLDGDGVVLRSEFATHREKLHFPKVLAWRAVRNRRLVLALRG